MLRGGKSLLFKKVQVSAQIIIPAICAKNMIMIGKTGSISRALQRSVIEHNNPIYTIAVRYRCEPPGNGKAEP